MANGDINQRVLDCPMQRNDAGAATIREYLIALLFNLWSEGEGFSGKRPFGNSAWEYEIYEALIAAGLVEGTFDEYDGVETVDYRTADRLVADAIRSLASSEEHT